MMIYLTRIDMFLDEFAILTVDLIGFMQHYLILPWEVLWLFEEPWLLACTDEKYPKRKHIFHLADKAADKVTQTKQEITIKKQSVILLHSTFLFLENLFYPGKKFWYICIDVGYIWVVTVILAVKGNNTNSNLPLVHQRATRITLWEGGSFITQDV